MRAHRSPRFLALGFAVALALGLAVASASQPAAFHPFFFIQLTDPQFGMFTGNAGFEQETANFEFAVATANRLKPAFVVVTGDLVNKTGDEAQICRVPASREEAGSGDPGLQRARQPRCRERADARTRWPLTGSGSAPIATSSDTPGLRRNRRQLVPGARASEGARGGRTTGAVAAGRAYERASEQSSPRRRLPAPPAVPEGRRRTGQLRRHPARAARPCSSRCIVTRAFATCSGGTITRTPSPATATSRS